MIQCVKYQQRLMSETMMTTTTMIVRIGAHISPLLAFTYLRRVHIRWFEHFIWIHFGAHTNSPHPPLNFEAITSKNQPNFEYINSCYFHFHMKTNHRHDRETCKELVFTPCIEQLWLSKIQEYSWLRITLNVALHFECRIYFWQTILVNGLVNMVD